MTYTIEVKNSQEIFDLLVEHRKRDLQEPSQNLVQALTEDYELWYKVNDWESPTKNDTHRWDQSNLRWIVASIDGNVRAYASLIIADRKNLSIAPGKVVDVQIIEGHNPLAIVPKLRAAIDDLFWLYGSQR